MILYRFRTLIFIVITLISGCKTTSVVQPEPSVTGEVHTQKPPELRGLYMNDDTD
jgi:hypothetical protein